MSLAAPGSWRITIEGEFVYVPESWLSCVVFLGYRGSAEPADATAFFVSVEEPDGVPHWYLVTAAHCVRDEVGLFMLVNFPSEVKEIDLPDGKDWEYHADDPENVDLAVLPFADSARIASLLMGYLAVPRSMLFDEAELTDEVQSGHGVADEVVSIGLFHVHTGTERNLPIVRTGNLAMIPKEPVRVEVKQAGHIVETREWLYLIEQRSIGGMSGSPVFKTSRHKLTAPSQVKLVGVLLGHWNARKTKPVLQEGIAMVAPARILGELLDKEDLVAQRKKSAQQRRDAEERAEAVRDRIAPTPLVSEEDFLRDLRKVTQPIDKPDQEGS